MQFGCPGEVPGAQCQFPHAPRVGRGFEGRFRDRLDGAQRPGRRPPFLEIMGQIVADRGRVRRAAQAAILVTMTYVADAERYERIPYRRCGRSGLRLPTISLGLWHNFGDDRALDVQRAILRRAFDLGVTHFDLANNYGPPYGSAEINFGRVLRKDLAPYRDEMIISTKTGYDMWPGPTGSGGRASTCSPASTSRCAGWASTTSTSSTATGSTRRRRWRRRWGAGPGRAVREGAVRGDLVVLARADGGGGGDPAGDGDAAADPPAVLLDAEPLDRGRAARHARPGGRCIASRSRRSRREC